jgi:hypothetical protein
MREFDYTPPMVAKFSFDNMYKYFLNGASRYMPGEKHKKLLTNLFYWSDSPILKLSGNDWFYFFDTTAELLPVYKEDRYLHEVHVMLENPMFLLDQCVPAEDAIWSGIHAFRGLQKAGYSIDAIAATSSEIMRYAGAWFNGDKHSRALALIEPLNSVIDHTLIGKVRRSPTEPVFLKEKQSMLSKTFIPWQS